MTVLRVARFIDGLVPKATTQNVEPRRARFLTVILFLGVVAPLWLLVTSIVRAQWSMATVTLAEISLCGWLLVRFRRGADYSSIVNTLLTLLVVTFCTPLLLERDLEGGAIATFALLPYMAALFQGIEAAKRWLFISCAATGACVLVRELHLFTPTVVLDTTTLVSRSLLLILGHFLVGLQFDRFRADSLAAVERADKSKSVFLANVSHEIRTPMNGVLGMTEVMLQSPLEAEQRERLLIVQRSGRALISLINDLLDLTKVEAGKLTIDRMDFSLTELMSDLQQLFGPLAEQKGLRLEMNLAPDVPTGLKADGLRLRQVLSNLVANALKFTEQGHVRVEVSHDEQPHGALAAEGKHWLRFTVEDSGIGIPPEVLPRLFTAFSQADSGTTRRYGGTGLGLALSRQLVVMMGGELTVETGVGVGSRFNFTLPTEASSAVATRPVLEAQPRPQPNHRTVLVVDDNVINLKVACAMVEKAGFATRTAMTGKQAVEAVAAGEFAFVLMDCHMPEMDGFEATERIRTLSGAASQTPVVALTASALPEELEACRRAGMVECLTKPLTRDALQKLLLKLESQAMARAS